MSSKPSGRSPGSTVDKTVLFLAARVLMVDGYSAEEAARVLREVYGVEVTPGLVRLWFNAIKVRRNSFLTSLIQSLTREKLPALAYIAGAIIGDGDNRGRLWNSDIQFITAFIKALAEVGYRREVRVKQEVYYTAQLRPLGRVIKGGLWRILARLYSQEFLSGLLDSEASLSPHIDHRSACVGLQLTFSNTDPEIAQFVQGMLKALGLRATLRTEIRETKYSIKGKIVSSRKPLHVVYSRIPLPKLDALKSLFHRKREQLLIRFFAAIRPLPPRLRYVAFSDNWVKNGKKWQPAFNEPPEEIARRYAEQAKRYTGQAHIDVN